MKFTEMKYERPDLESVKKEIQALVEAFAGAESYEAAHELFLKKDALTRHVMTFREMAQIRHSIDTRDPFYESEMHFWNGAMPRLQEDLQAWTMAMLKSPFRGDFEKQYGTLLFANAEIELTTFRPEIIGDLQTENDLAMAYEKLLATAQIPFEGSHYSLEQMMLFKTDQDDERRLAAWKAEGQWFNDNQPELDRLYDELVKVRDGISKKLGHESFIDTAYNRMLRNCYTKEDVDRFRRAVVKYLVPVADAIYRDQARRLNVSYPINFSEMALEFRSGNPRPLGGEKEVMAQTMKFFEELSPETGEFFHFMTDRALMDVPAREGKEGGAYCTALPEPGYPYIVANFSGTSHDVITISHEAGHAFEGYLNRSRVPVDYMWPGYEACEVHSMSMEFFTWPWAEGFFGPEADKFRYSHLSQALTFIPYGTLVDHFQHSVFEKPEMTPEERHSVWKELMGIYMPWVRLDGEIPFFSEGRHWQRKHHIYSCPFYYIDYCLAQTVALEFWTEIGVDRDKAWQMYMAYTTPGGSRTFKALLSGAGLESPFDEACLKKVCLAAKEWLDDFDMSGIE